MADLAVYRAISAMVAGKWLAASGAKSWNGKTIGAALEKMQILKGGKAYIRVRRNRELKAPRRETQGFCSGGEDKEVPSERRNFIHVPIEEERQRPGRLVASGPFSRRKLCDRVQL
jgi:hypothetical protein